MQDLYHQQQSLSRTHKVQTVVVERLDSPFRAMILLRGYMDPNN